MALCFGSNIAVAMKQKEKQLNNVVQQEKIFKGHDGAISNLLLIDNVLVSSSEDKSVRIWNATTGKCLQVINDCVDKGCTGNNLAYMSHNIVAFLAAEKITFWDIKNNKNFNTIKVDKDIEEDLLMSNCFTTNGKNTFYFTSYYNPSSSHIFSLNVEKNERLKVIEKILVSGAALRLISLNNNTLLVYSDLDSRGSAAVTLLDEITRKKICTFDSKTKGFPFPSYGILSAANIDNNIIAFITYPEYQNIRFWDIKANKCIKGMTAKQGGLIRVLIYLGENILISGSTDNTIKFWDIQSGACLSKFEVAPNIKELSFFESLVKNVLGISEGKSSDKHENFSLILSPDKKFLFAGLSDGRILKLRIPSAFWPKEKFSKILFDEFKNKNPKPDIFFKFEEQI